MAVERLQDNPHLRTNHLLIIGIDKYQHHPPLNNARRDAETLRDILVDKYQFEEDYVVSLCDEEATRQNILQAFIDFRDKLTPQDNLLVYFAGHGTMTKSKSQGFWIPVTAQSEVDFIPNGRIRSFISDMKAHHIYLLVDACFSGSMILRSTDQFVKYAEENPSRRVLTSGRKEVVSDGKIGGHSPFFKALKHQLDHHSGSYLSCLDLELHVTKNTSNNARQMPEANVIFETGDLSGKFVFYPKRSEKGDFEMAKGNVHKLRSFLEAYPNGKYTEEAHWEIALLSNTALAFDDYLEEFPKGKWAAEARKKLREAEEREQFERIQNNPQLSKIRGYLNEFPKGKHREEVLKIRQELRKRRQPLPPEQEPKPTVDTPMIRVEGGTFQMSEDYKVTLSDYAIGTYPVTQKLWQEIIGNNPSRFKGDLMRPVENVSWEDCQEFLQKLNQKTGLNYRLPTEAQWEFAARGGNLSKGFEYAGSNRLDEVGWYENNSKNTTHPVGQKASNELGLYDMSGNVWEWCQDWYGDYPYGSHTDPQGPTSGDYRVIRGGSWDSGWRGCRVADRYFYMPANRYFGIGFRLSRHIEQSP
ncbi:MAG: SUMF1/EgtB/PvdO family nonheme iron enzyme [Bacteroidota bacterium]